MPKHHDGCVSQNPPWVNKVMSAATVDLPLFPDSLLAMRPAIVKQRPVELSSKVLCPRLSVEKNRANSLVRLNGNSQYQPFLRSAPLQYHCATRAADALKPGISLQFDAGKRRSVPLPRR